jgi:hypothetical protein
VNEFSFDRGAAMAGETATYQSVAQAYEGFVSDEKVYLIETVRCTPEGVQNFIDGFESLLPAREELSSNLVPIGAWRNLFGDYDEVTHVYGFDSLQQLEVEFKRVPRNRCHLDIGAEESGQVPLSRWQVSRSGKVMRPLPYCPNPLPTGPPTHESTDRVFFTIQGHCTRSGIGDWIKHYDVGIAHRRGLDPSLAPVGAWRSLYGGLSCEIIHFYAYESLADMERLRKVLFKDPTFQEHIKINTSPNPPNFWQWSAHSGLMKALTYSQM